MTGWVSLVGAGPGDPSLITLRAIERLKEADIVLYDNLAHPNLLQYTTAECISVGKQKGKHSINQSEINDLMISYAKKGKNVVRLKGGDPLIFGRGGEEMMILKENNIPFDVVPGITAATAVPAYAGIPLTHREWSRSVAFVTGTTMDGSRIQDKPLPDADTLVFFMAVTHLKDICESLIQKDRFSENTPAALIYQGTTSAQKVVQGTLSTIHTHDLEPPSLLIVGKVATLTETLNWWSQKPLSGKRIVILREKEKAIDMATQLNSLGAEVIIIPMLDIAPIPFNEDLSAYTDIIFTSQNGVECFMNQLIKNGQDARDLAGKNLLVVGPKTAEKLKSYGLNADDMPAKYVSDEILTILPQQLSGRSILLPVAAKARDVLPNGLKARGANVNVLPVYDTKKPQNISGTIQDTDTVVFTSPSTVENLLSSGLWTTQHITAISIGPVTTKTLEESAHPATIITAKSSQIESLIDTIINHG